MTGYISIYNNSFGLFQYYFWQLVLIVPYIVIVLGMIYLFYKLIRFK